MTPRAFQVRVEPVVLEDLHTRLRETRWARVPGTSDWEAGTSPDALRRLVERWQSTYDWPRHEARIDAVAHFKVEIEGADLHYVHERGRAPNAVPLLLLHGWPDSFHRYHRVIQPLVAASFEVVVPSLPGFPFTGRVKLSESQPNRHTARLLYRLMTEVLGHERFAVAGGDGGSVLAQILALDHPDAVIGLHLTDLGWPAFGVDPETLSKEERKHLESSQKAAMADGAYMLVQSTRPRSLAALDDSPVGLLSWIFDRFHSWSENVDDDDVLTTVMLHWASGTIAPSMFHYFADRRSPSLTLPYRVESPVALALFPKDIGGIPPRRFAERTLDVRRWTEMPRGGHFAALEEPTLWVNDVVEFFGTTTSPAREMDREVNDGHPTV